MKTLKLILVFFVLPLFTIAQIPKGFNYQAVIRNSSGLPIASQNVSVRITVTDNTGTPVYYQEVHAKQTSAQGIVNLVVGLGTAQNQGDINNVAWKDGNKWIKVEVDKNDGLGYNLMGLIELQSVPYAQYAVNGSWTNEHTIESTSNVGVDQPIFEVKNKLGQTVFGVYDGGVRVYVEKVAGKGSKGGFAVGGLSSKGTLLTPEYLRITPDSARIWINEIPTSKGGKGGFAVGGLSSKSTSNQLIQLTPNNYFIGYESGINIKTGLYNSFFGYQSGKFTNYGGNNVFSGYQSGYANTYGAYNVFNGYQSGYGNTEGTHNVFIGHTSGYSNTTGWSNNFIGQGAGYSNTTGTNNIFIGNDAGKAHTKASGNIFIGRNSGFALTGDIANDYWGNVFIGNLTGANMTTGSTNLIAGVNAASEKTSGNNNVILGSYAGTYSAGGNYNVYVGAGSGNNASGNYNVFLGYNAGYSETGSNKLYIDNSSTSNPLIGGDFTEKKVTISNILNVAGINYTPSSPAKGDIVRFEGNSSHPTNGLYIYDGTSWKMIISL